MRETCVACGGRGSRRRSSFSTPGATIESTCPDCKGTGYVLPPAEDLAAEFDAALRRAEALDADHTLAIQRLGEVIRERDEARAALADKQRELDYQHSQWQPTVSELHAAHATMRRVAEALRAGPVHSDVQGWARALAAELGGEDAVE